MTLQAVGFPWPEDLKSDFQMVQVASLPHLIPVGPVPFAVAWSRDCPG